MKLAVERRGDVMDGRGKRRKERKELEERKKERRCNAGMWNVGGSPLERWRVVDMCDIDKQKGYLVGVEVLTGEMLGIDKRLWKSETSVIKHVKDVEKVFF